MSGHTIRNPIMLRNVNFSINPDFIRAIPANSVR